MNGFLHRSAVLPTVHSSEHLGNDQLCRSAKQYGVCTLFQRAYIFVEMESCPEHVPSSLEIADSRSAFPRALILLDVVETVFFGC